MQTCALHHTSSAWRWDGRILRPEHPHAGRFAIEIILEARHLGRPFVGKDRDLVRVEAGANKALISAAPLLLEAARAAMAALLRHQRGWCGAAERDAAIAKLRAAIAATQLGAD